MKATFKHLFSFYLTPCYSKHLFSMCIGTLREKKSSPAERDLEVLFSNGFSRNQQWALAFHPGEAVPMAQIWSTERKGKILYWVNLELASGSKDINKRNCTALENVPCHNFTAGYPKIQPPRQELNFVFSHTNISLLEVNNGRYNFWRNYKLPICGQIYIQVFISPRFLQCLNNDFSLKHLSL